MAEIIGSILAADAEDLQQQCRQAAMAGADWLELRLDKIPLELNPADVLPQLRLPVLVACRTPRDGGYFHGTLEERRELLLQWLRAGVQGVDLEDWETWEPPALPSLRLRIRSHHNFKGVSANLPAIRDQLLAGGANLCKIVVTAHDLCDASPVLDLLGATDQEGTPTVAFAMGQQAWPTRVLACALGAPFAYASVSLGQQTAPGQVPVAELAGLYDVRRISASTGVYGVLGNPLGHSLSPLLHNRAFRKLEHDGIYLPFETSRPLDLLHMLSRRRLRGLSITAPHKGALIEACHELDAAAEQAGVINTLSFVAHGRVRGSNSDLVGVRDALLRAGLQPGDRGGGVVLGGGGAARAAALALRQLGLGVCIMPRSLEPVRRFAEAQGMQLARQDARLMDEIRPRVVVHATPVGGADSPGERPLPDWRIPAGTFVLDMNYRPRRTRLLADTEDAGGIPVPGLWMFLSQAREQVHLFTGRQLPVEVLAELCGEL